MVMVRLGDAKAKPEHSRAVMGGDGFGRVDGGSGFGRVDHLAAGACLGVDGGSVGRGGAGLGFIGWHARSNSGPGGGAMAVGGLAGAFERQF